MLLQINRLIKEIGAVPINKCTNKFNNLITLGKDKDEDAEKNSVVYQVNCIDCDANYVGQTFRKMKKRIDGHIRDGKNDKDTSALAQHCKNMNHIVDLSNVKILDIEKNHKKRFYAEMFNIHYHNNTINRKEDTEFLKNIYKNTINIVKNNCKI